MARTVSFFTQGCRLNQSETAILERSFEQLAFQVVPFDAPADLVVINTCTVTENGDQDTKRLVSKINRVSETSKIALVGCQSQILKEKLLELPNVKWVVGNSQKFELAQLVQQGWDVDEPVLRVEKIDRQPFVIPTPGIDRHHTRANIKIQDGCDFYCAFCVIPFARGPARSRVFDDIIKEIRALVDAGHREVVVTGINLGTYAYEGKTFADVLTVLQGVPDLKRIRISSIEPTTISDEVVTAMVQPDSKVCRYLHVPLQSGSDTILKAMNRHYTTAEYDVFIRNFVNRVPSIGLGTDVIVGFPGETDALFEETVAFLTQLPLAYFHVFSYSERQFARSQKLPDKVSADVVAQRSARLRALSIQKRQAYLSRFLGQTELVLVEQCKRGYWMGLTDHYIRVKFKSEKGLANQLVKVQLNTLDGETVIGELKQ